MPWRGSLRLDYAKEGGRSVARFAHDGPLRILQSLYPEGDAVCHNVLVHPPGGLVAISVMAMAMYELFSAIEKHTTGWAHRGSQAT